MSQVQLQRLQRDGVVRLPGLVAASTLARMQHAFAAQLRYPSFNTWQGYQQNERWRRLVEDCLLLDQGFVECALDPSIQTLLEHYLGGQYVLTEARGWETIATRRNFHGWHNDAWYDQTLTQVPRQLKLGLYLSEVESGQFRYLAGSHRLGLPPGHWNDAQVEAMDGEIIDIFGAAGDAFLFDTSGIHRQASPVRRPRWAVFFNFHDPATPLQPDETRYGRYRPLRLNAACLPHLQTQDQRVLGIGQATVSHQIIHRRRFAALHATVTGLLRLRLYGRDLQDQWARVWRKLAELFRTGGR